MYELYRLMTRKPELDIPKNDAKLPRVLGVAPNFNLLWFTQMSSRESEILGLLANQNLLNRAMLTDEHKMH